MKTTLNIPDDLARRAKRVALEEGTTLTQLIVVGLEARLRQARRTTALPVSATSGGLCDGVSWENLSTSSPDVEGCR